MRSLTDVLNETANLLQENADVIANSYTNPDGKFLFSEDERIYNRHVSLIADLREHKQQLDKLEGEGRN